VRDAVDDTETGALDTAADTAEPKDLVQFDVDPTECDPRRVTSVLSFGGLGEGAVAFEDVAFVVASEQFASFEEAQAMLASLCSGPCYGFPGEDQGAFGELEYFYAREGDFGGALFIDRQTFDPVFAGTIVWMGGGGRYWPSAQSPVDPLRFGGSPVAPEFSGVVVAPNSHWTSSPAAQEAWELARSSDLLASYEACGDFSVVVWVYTPSVGLTDPEVAKVLVMVTGQTTGRWLSVD